MEAGNRADSIVLMNPSQMERDQPRVEESHDELTEHGTAAATTRPPSTSPDAEGNVITTYLREQETICERSQTENSMSLPRCPCLPPGLAGRITPNVTDDADGWRGIWKHIHSAAAAAASASINSTKAGEVLAGGEWKPSHCEARTRLAIVVPCRDRDSHLRIMLRHLYTVLQRQLVHFRIFVVEQNSPAVFNKAAMMNVGFLEAQKRFPEMNCVMFHDVDHLPEDDRMLMTCSDQPHHYAVALDQWSYKMLYTGLFGGVVSMRPELFIKVNGYSLNYFGWGGEDDDMGNRVRQIASVYRPPRAIARYTTLKHYKDPGNPVNNRRHQLMADQRKQYVKQKFEGLNDVRYELNDVQLRPLYTWLHADLDVMNLSYVHHPVGSYRKFINSVCRSTGGVTSAGDISWITCRYLCDTAHQRPCVGFMYRREPNELVITAPAKGQSVSVTTEDNAVSKESHVVTKEEIEEKILLASYGKSVEEMYIGHKTSLPKCSLISTYCDLEVPAAGDTVVTYIKVLSKR